MSESRSPPKVRGCQVSAGKAKQSESPADAGGVGRGRFDLGGKAEPEEPLETGGERGGPAGGDGDNRGDRTSPVTGGSARPVAVPRQAGEGGDVVDKAKRNNPNGDYPTWGAPRRQIRVRSCPGVAVQLGTTPVSPARGGSPGRAGVPGGSGGGLVRTLSPPYLASERQLGGLLLLGAMCSLPPVR